jgi:hypothetical protein
MTMHYNKRCPCMPSDFTSYSERGTSEKVVNSLVEWTGISELHPHFVIVMEEKEITSLI